MSTTENESVPATTTEVTTAVTDGRVEGSELTGTVKRYNSKNGFGFIAADDEGPDLFVHQSEIKTDGFRCLEEGAKVKFIYTMREGKPTAKQVDGIDGPLKVYKSRLEAAMVAHVKPGFEMGTVKWFNAGKGFGFVRKDAGTEQDVDIFVHIKDCEGMMPLREQQKVMFTIETEDSGRLRALNVSTPGMAAPQVQMYPPMGQPQYYAPPPQQYGAPPPQQYGYAPPPAQLPTHAPALKTHGAQVGSIKFYNTVKGFGFIITPMNTELYLGATGLTDPNWVPAIGDNVEYTEETNTEKVWAMNARKTDAPVSRKRGIEAVAGGYPAKQPRVDMYQQSAHGQYAPPQPAYNPAPQYQQPPAQPPAQYSYDQQYQQPAPAAYDYSRPAY